MSTGNLWDFSDAFVTFDNSAYTFDGILPITGNMPNLIGQELYDAIEILQVLDIYVPASIGYFGTFPISVVWQQSSMEPGTVLNQVPPIGSNVTANFPITLFVSAFPVSVAFP